MEHLDHLENKVGRSVLAPIEEKIIAWAVRRIPRVINSRMLTFATLPLCVAMTIAAGRAHGNEGSGWLLVMAGIIMAQWLTDSLDGALGRYTQSGLKAWGFYVDHLSDFLFLVTVLYSFSRIADSSLHSWLWAIAAAVGGIMTSTFLVAAASGRFQITHGGFGPTEARLVVAAALVGAYCFGTSILAWLLPEAFGLAALAFVTLAVKEARTMWRLDAANGSRVASSLAPDASPVRELVVILGGRSSSRSGRRRAPQDRRPARKAESANR